MKKIEFPYYIVRFKPSHTVCQLERDEKFPYYIVRFKLTGIFAEEVNEYSFHTT